MKQTSICLILFLSLSVAVWAEQQAGVKVAVHETLVQRGLEWAQPKLPSIVKSLHIPDFKFDIIIAAVEVTDFSWLNVKSAEGSFKIQKDGLRIMEAFRDISMQFGFHVRVLGFEEKCNVQLAFPLLGASIGTGIDRDAAGHLSLDLNSFTIVDDSGWSVKVIGDCTGENILLQAIRILWGPIKGLFLEGTLKNFVASTANKLLADIPMDLPLSETLRLDARLMQRASTSDNGVLALPLRGYFHVQGKERRDIPEPVNALPDRTRTPPASLELLTSSFTVRSMLAAAYDSHLRISLNESLVNEDSPFHFNTTHLSLLFPFLKMNLFFKKAFALNWEMTEPKDLTKMVSFSEGKMHLEAVPQMTMHVSKCWTRGEDCDPFTVNVNLVTDAELRTTKGGKDAIIEGRVQAATIRASDLKQMTQIDRPISVDGLNGFLSYASEGLYLPIANGCLATGCSVHLPELMGISVENVGVNIGNDFIAPSLDVTKIQPQRSAQWERAVNAFVRESLCGIVQSELCYGLFDQ